MSGKPNAVEKWKQLHREWSDADQWARRAQGEIRLAFERGRLGSAGPTLDAVRQADELQRKADWLRIALDAHVMGALRGFE